MGPTQDAHGGAGEQQLGQRVAPDHLIHEVVGPVRHVADAVAIEVEAGIVAPVIADAVVGPLDVASADILHLRRVADEAVARDDVAFGAGGEVDADGAALEEIAADRVAVRVIEEDALGAAVAHEVAFDARLVGEVEEKPVVAVACGAVAEHAQAIRVHQRVAHVVVARDVAAHLAVVGVHVVKGKAEIAEAVVAKCVLAAGGDEDAVAAIAHGVALYHRALGRPQVDAVAAFAHAQAAVSDHLVVPHQRVPGAVQIDAEQVVLKPIAFDQRASCRLVEKDTGVGLGEAEARVAHGEPAHHHVGRGDAEHPASPAAVEDGAGRTLQREGPVDANRPRIDARRQPDHRASRSRIQRRLQRPLARNDLDDGGRRGAHPACGGGEQRHRRAEDKRRAPQTHQAVFGFTNMRPRISM